MKRLMAGNSNFYSENLTRRPELAASRSGCDKEVKAGATGTASSQTEENAPIRLRLENASCSVGRALATPKWHGELN